jgi:hypothetical protein
MKSSFLQRIAFLFSMLVLISACGGGGGSGGGDPTVEPPPGDDPQPVSTILSGTAAAGAPIVGTVTVKDALGNTKSALIEANGNYNVDVSGMTPPFRLRAEGTVGGKTYRLHSYAEAADVGGTVNITPFTDLIVANAAGQIAEQFFDSATETSIEPAELEAQEEALQAKLQNVFDALGLGTAIDLLNQSFSADKSGLDAALDAVRIEVDPVLNQATITNLVNQDAAPIIDDLQDTQDNSESLEVTDADAITNSANTNQAIADMIADFTGTFANGLPTPAQIDDFIADDFLEWDTGKSAFITDITTAPELIGLQFAGLNISDLDSQQGTARIEFNARVGGVIERGATSSFPWFVSNDPTLGWQLRGNQLIADVQELSYHCADSDPNDQIAGSCLINTAVFDNDFSNNGTGGQAIASATVSLLDGQNPSTTKAIIYLGNPDFSAPGELFIYNVPDQGQQQGFYSGDARLFGNGLNRIDPSLFQVGDIVEYRLYSQALNVTDPANPSVSVGQEVATYSSTLLFEPSLTPLFPSATADTVNAINNFTLDNDLTIAWSLSPGTLIDEVLVEISDNSGNRIEIFDESMTSDDTSTTISATQLSSAAANAAGLDGEAASYALMVRIYAIDPATGQNHSQSYHAPIPGPGAGGDGGGSTTNPVSFSGNIQVTATTTVDEREWINGNGFNLFCGGTMITDQLGLITGYLSDVGVSEVFVHQWEFDVVNNLFRVYWNDDGTFDQGIYDPDTGAFSLSGTETTDGDGDPNFEFTFKFNMNGTFNAEAGTLSASYSETIDGTYLPANVTVQCTYAETIVGTTNITSVGPSETDFTAQEVANSTFFASFTSEDARCGTGHVVEAISYTDTQYTLRFCDGTTEVGSYEIVNGDIKWNVPGGGTDFTRRISLDNGAGGWSVCTTELQADLDNCAQSAFDNYDMFTSATVAEAFAATQNGLTLTAPEVPLSGQYFGDGTEPGMLVFYPNGFYINWSGSVSDQNCAETTPGGGVEYGSYAYDGTTLSVSTWVDFNASCGLSFDFANGLPVNLNPDGSLVFGPGQLDEETIPRVDGGSGSIVGSWTGAMDGSAGIGALVFFPNGQYMHWSRNPANPDCYPGGDGYTTGVEYGSYALDGLTLSGTASVDGNGFCGLSDGQIPAFSISTVDVVGDQISVQDGESSVTFNRL